MIQSDDCADFFHMGGKKPPTGKIHPCHFLLPKKPFQIPGGGFRYSLCSYLFGERFPFWLIFCQRGWFNHQLELILINHLLLKLCFLGAPNLPGRTAPGGFGADFTSNSLLAQYRPDLLHLPTTNGEHCTGDGIKMGDAWCFLFVFVFCLAGTWWWWWWWSSQTRSDGVLAGLTCCRFLHSNATHIWLSSSYPQHVIGMHGGDFSLGCYTDLEIYSLGFFRGKFSSLSGVGLVKHATLVKKHAWKKWAMNEGI